MAGLWTTQGKAATVPRPEQWNRIREALGFDDTEIRPLVAELNARKGSLGEGWAAREVVGEGHRVRYESDVQLAPLSTGSYPLTAPATATAQHWDGWNTQLKPAHEPIVLARKGTGYDSTVANVLLHGTGALNIDACRTEAGQDYLDKCASVVGLASNRNGATLGEWTGTREDSSHPAGRWPTNILLGHTPTCADPGCDRGCPVAELGQQARFFPTFRYEAKAPASERPRGTDGTVHTTVKPLALMRWLVRLVTPPRAVVLDPFAGSGTTLEAAVLEGARAVGVEQHEPYAALCRARLDRPLDLPLFTA
ncbi:site-specific DNA-methyltransferase [Kitasatospora sp. NPDC002551]|uniref:site-specific DNA-methyltransferase n=1 Tax=Kitasatospora sp. NPDC002551 TaxID=3154539 RepID=UPI003327A379